MGARRTIAALLAGTGALGFSPSASAEPLDLFTGSFSGSGTVIEGPNANSHRVRCEMNSSQQGRAGLLMRGTCWAYLIMSRSITADLVLNSQSGEVSGTYTGARVGQARLSGKRQGNSFDLIINWPKPVYGNMTSDMTIASSNPDRLRIVVIGRIGENGPLRAMTDLVLTRR